MHTQRFITFLKIWVQFRVGAIPRLPIYLSIYSYPMLFYYKFCKYILALNEIEISELATSSYTKTVTNLAETVY